MKRSQRLTRREKQLQERLESKQALVQPTPSPKPLPRLDAKNANQKLALRYLSEDKRIVILMGSAGTGKSLLAAHRIASQLRAKAKSKAYLVRPAVLVGKTVGLLPGTVEEKLAPFFAQTIAHLGKFLSPSTVEYDLKAGRIEMKPVEYLRGMSFEDCIVLVEEAQNLTHEEMEMLLTRLGDNCQLILTGDTKQHDLKGESGLDTTLKLLNRMLQTQPEYMDDDDLDALDDDIGVVRFTPEDVVRSGLTRAFVKMYFHNS